MQSVKKVYINVKNVHVFNVKLYKCKAHLIFLPVGLDLQSRPNEYRHL